MNKWDRYFLDICNVVGSTANCYSRKIGSVLVKDRCIIATGKNGPPRGVPHCEDRNDVKVIEGECPRRTAGYKSGEGLHLCIAAHAERNCLIQAARLGTSTVGTKLYLNTNIPCKDCLIEIINAGVEEIICTDLSLYDKASEFLIKHSVIRIRTFDNVHF